jgi:hypothetical protein
VVQDPDGRSTRGVSSETQPARYKAVMNWFDLTKATLFCGGLAFLIYSFPVIGQIFIIGVLAVLWLGYARKTLARLRRS